MDWLNYHHLLYFWTVAREGSVSRAAETLRLAQPTVSAQLKVLESSVGQRLFERQGRRLVLTDVGRIVFRYADEIFGIGRELIETLNGRAAGRALQLTVGVANAVPKLIVHRLLEPALRGPEPMRLICREDNPEPLATQLATHALDVVISDTPAPPHVRVRVFNHLLGESGTSFFAAAAQARHLRTGFPRSLTGARMLVPTSNTSHRRALEQWFQADDLHPRIVAEFEDSALLSVFGEAEGAVFSAPTVIEDAVCRYYRVKVIGRTAAVRDRFYAISAERRLKHPGVLAITGAARAELFAASD